MSKIDDQTSVHTSLNKCNSEPELNNPNITYNPLNSNHYTNKDPNNDSNTFSFKYSQSLQDQNKDTMCKPSAPPMSHNVVYPDPSKIYYPQTYTNSHMRSFSDFEV